MRSVAVFNNKGGVGKTTLLCNLSAYFADLGKKVAVIDADPQCNSTQGMLNDDLLETLYEKKKGSTIWEIFRPIKSGKGYVHDIQITRARSFHLDLIPGDPRMSLMEDLLSADWISAIGGNERGLRTTYVFSDLLSHFQDYDYVFFDMGPSLGAINRAVLVASDYYIVPMSIDIFSLQAIRNIATVVADWSGKLNDGLARLDDPDSFIPNARWKLKFAGYVTQQYTYRRDVHGNPRPVAAYERIVNKFPKVISEHLAGEGLTKEKYLLGSIPFLSSLIPLSQGAHKPIFSLKAEDGVVGAHFARVRDYKDIVAKIAEGLEANCEALE